MQNMMVLENGYIQTAYGVFGGVTSYDKYETGELRSVRLDAMNMVLTHAGELVPAYTETERRKFKPSVLFYRSGMIKAVSLEDQQEVETPIGEFPAELITFYESGEVKRIFPLDGKLSGFWSEEDERELQIPFHFDLGFCTFTARINCVNFFRDGAIRSVTLYPEESIQVATKFGEIKVRNGFSLYQSGELESVEPTLPVAIRTPIGTITAYDSEAVGLSADSNSLVFDQAGNLVSLVTTMNRIGVQTEDDRFLWYAPSVFSPSPEEKTEVLRGLRLDFTERGVRINGEEEFLLSGTGFTILPFQSGATSCSPTDCANCTLCK